MAGFKPGFIFSGTDTTFVATLIERYPVVPLMSYGHTKKSTLSEHLLPPKSDVGPCSSFGTRLLIGDSDAPHNANPIKKNQASRAE